MAKEEKSAVEQAAEERSSQEEAVAAAEEKGYLGDKPESAFSNEDFSLQSGPDSPSALDQEIESLKLRVSDLEASRGNN